MSYLKKSNQLSSSLSSISAAVGGVTAHPGSIRTMADLREAVGELDLPTQTIRVLKANIGTAAVVAAAAAARKKGRSISLTRDDAMLATVPVDPAWLNDNLWAYSAAICGTKEQCRALSISGTRRAMREFNLIDPYSPSTEIPADSAWRKLLDRLEHAYAETALATFAVWAHQERVSPEEVTPDHVAAFERWIRTRTLHKEIPRLVSNICKAWRIAVTLLPGSNHTALTPPVRRTSSTLPWSEFAPVILAEVDEALEWYRGGDRKGPFRGKGRRRILEPTTIKIRRYCLLQALSAAVKLGLKTPLTVRLADLVEPSIFEAILEFYWKCGVERKVDSDAVQAGAEDPSLGVTSQTGSIAATLMVLARHYFKVPQDALMQLRDMAQDVTPEPQDQLSRKNRERLRQFDDPVTRAKLLHLPQRIKELVEAGNYRPLEAARMARVAAAVEFLLHIPVRNGNLCKLRLGVHLRYDGNRHGYIRRLVLERHETKNNYEGEWPIGDDLGSFLDWYIKDHRPLLAADGNDYLFPAGFEQAGAISNCAMYQSIVRTVANFVGAELNPHLFRCLCAYFILERSPEALEDVRLMIGDKSLEIVLRHYAASQPRHAVERVDNLLRELRYKSADLAKGLSKPSTPRVKQGTPISRTRAPGGKKPR